jgi:hypothetical protein
MFLHCNELPQQPIHSNNAEQIDDYLATAPAVLMNPPFSTSPNIAKRNRQAVFMHVRSAMDRLADRGRLVAIAPRWFNPEMCDSFKKYPAQLRLSAYIPGSAYRYHDTTMETRLLVFDKIENSGPVKSIAPKFEDLLAIPRFASQTTNAPRLPGLSANTQSIGGKERLTTKPGATCLSAASSSETDQDFISTRHPRSRLPSTSPASLRTSYYRNARNHI